MKRIIMALVIGLASMPGGVVVAQDGPIKQRQAIMKKNGEASDLVVKMFKGESPYDAKVAAAAITSIGVSADEFVKLFPEGSDKGSYAKPEIWQKKADFEGWAAQLKEDSGKAAAAAASGMDALQPAFAELAKSCRGCHEDYRVPE